MQTTFGGIHNLGIGPVDFSETVSLIAAGEPERRMSLAEAVWQVAVEWRDDPAKRHSAFVLRDYGPPLGRWTEFERLNADMVRQRLDASGPSAIVPSAGAGQLVGP